MMQSSISFHSQKYNFRCKTRADVFEGWERGEMATIEFGQWQKRKGKTGEHIAFTKHEIPVPYDRIVSQLIAEHVHAQNHDSHESRHRANYAAKVLDVFGDELKTLNTQKLPATFRSKVLTPILQRQRVGLHDTYTPYVRAGINSQDHELTIEDVTKFYLQTDPTDPDQIISYRRNLLYLPDSRWHLGVLLGVAAGSADAAADHYTRVRDNHDKIMKSLQEEGYGEPDDGGVPPLSRTEVEAIIDEGLEDFFDEELQLVVRDPFIVHWFLIAQFNSPTRWPV